MTMQGQKGNLSKRDRKAMGGAQANGAGGGRRITTENPADPSLVGKNRQTGGSTGSTTSVVTAVTPGSFGGAPKTFGRAGYTHLAN